MSSYAIHTHIPRQISHKYNCMSRRGISSLLSRSHVVRRIYVHMYINILFAERVSRHCQHTRGARKSHMWRWWQKQAYTWIVHTQRNVCRPVAACKNYATAALSLRRQTQLRCEITSRKFRKPSPIIVTLNTCDCLNLSNVYARIFCRTYCTIEFNY